MSNVRWLATVRFWSILSQCCINVWCFSMKFYKILECLESHFRLHFLQKLIHSKGTSKIYRIGFCGHRLSKPRRKICSIHVSVWNEFTSSLFYHHHHEFDERFDMACEFIMWHRFGSVRFCCVFCIECFEQKPTEISSHSYRGGLCLNAYLVVCVRVLVQTLCMDVIDFVLTVTVFFSIR